MTVTTFARCGAGGLRATAGRHQQPRRLAPAGGVRQHGGAGASLALRRRVRVNGEAGGDASGNDAGGASEQEKAAQMREAYEAAMKDPKARAQMEGMQKMMQSPEVQDQMKQAASVMQDPSFKAKIESLRDDPEFKEMFEELKSGGMGALMKFWNDPKTLMKLSSKLGPPSGAAASAGPPGQVPPQQQEMPVADNLIDAAKYGDMEAIEDYIAIGRDVNEGDKEGRTPLHFASGGGHFEIAQALIEAGASVDAKDAKENTPLHYATGYGRVAIANLLIDKGSQVGLQNGNGRKASDLAKLNPDNPLLKDEELMKKLNKSTFVDT